MAETRWRCRNCGNPFISMFLGSQGAKSWKWGASVPYVGSLSRFSPQCSNVFRRFQFGWINAGGEQGPESPKSVFVYFLSKCQRRVYQERMYSLLAGPRPSLLGELLQPPLSAGGAVLIMHSPTCARCPLEPCKWSPQWPLVHARHHPVITLRFALPVVVSPTMAAHVLQEVRPWHPKPCGAV